MTTEAIQTRMDDIAEDYLFLAERIQDDLNSVGKIQENMSVCLAELSNRGITVEMPEGMDSGSSGN